MKKLFSLITLNLFFLLNQHSCEAKQIHEHGFWIGTDLEEEHAFDAPLSQSLTQFFIQERTKSIVDFGCGKGDYVKVFKKNGLVAEGYDGNPDSSKLSGGLVQVLDLSQPFSLGKTYDWVVSLEVGEHIPKQYEKIFIQNLVKHSKHGIVLSWAIKGQGGYGHVNTQNNDYIKAQFAQYGFRSDDKAAARMRNSARLSWFKNTIMVFRKKS